jgi:hypothetical protein
MKSAFTPFVLLLSVLVFFVAFLSTTHAQTLDEIAEAYAAINRTITPEMMVKPVAVPESFDTIMGAKFNEWVAVLQRNQIKM